MSAETFSQPRWFDEFSGAYQRGEAQAFIAHGNVRDYAVPGWRVTPYLAELLKKRDVVAVYNRSEGIVFPLDATRPAGDKSPTHREKFMTALGLDKKPAAPDPMVAALSGGQAAAKPVSLPTEPSGAIPLLEQLLRAQKIRAAVIIQFGESLAPNGNIAQMQSSDRDVLVTLARWGTDAGIAARGGVVILQTDALVDLHVALRSAANGWRAFEIPLPDRSRRLEFIKWYLAENSGVKLEMKAEELANSTAGLELVHIENIFLSVGEGDQILKRDLARREGARWVSQEYAGRIKIIEPRAEIGGMEQYRAWALADVVDPIKTGRFADAVRSFLLTGPPGCGKTHSVAWLAYQLGFNAIEIVMEQIQEGIVGASERNLAQVFGIARSLAPVILFMDEVDQSDISSRGNASGNPVAKNLFSQFLRFLQEAQNDPEHPIIFIGATNRPDLLDDAWKRSGRIEAIVPIMLPERDDRVSVVLTQAVMQGVKVGDEVACAIADQTEGWSRSDLGAVVKKARKLALRAERADVSEQDARRALESLSPATLESAQWFSELAVAACSDKELLPPKYRALLDNRGQLEALIKAGRPDDVRRGKREL